MIGINDVKLDKGGYFNNLVLVLGIFFFNYRFFGSFGDCMRKLVRFFLVWIWCNYFEIFEIYLF